MAVTAQTGVLSFGAQTGKGVPATTFYKHRASDIDLATISDDRLGPPEVGGIPTPTIPYRAGVMASGGATIMPRLQNTFGWLLHGALGRVSSTAGQDALGATVTGITNHEFLFHTDAGFVPWMNFRKEIPGSASDNSDDLGENYSDCKIVALTFTLPNDGLITSRVDVLGRAAEQIFDDAPSWTYGNTLYEDYESIPIGCTVGGYLKVPGFSATALPITQATISLTNAPLDIRQEKVYGSPYLEDVTIIGRQAQIDVIVKWNDPQLYMSILTGSTTGTNWVSAPFVQDLDVYALSPATIPGTSPLSPWGMRVRAAAVMYQVVGGIRLAGGQAVMMRLQGTAIASAGEYLRINVGNTVAATGYAWPT